MASLVAIRIIVLAPFQETTEEPIDVEGKNFDDIKAPVGKSLPGPALSCFIFDNLSLSLQMFWFQTENELIKLHQ